MKFLCTVSLFFRVSLLHGFTVKTGDVTVRFKRDLGNQKNTKDILQMELFEKCECRVHWYFNSKRGENPVKATLKWIFKITI